MSPPSEERGSCSCGPTRSEFAGQVEGGAPQGARSGWVFADSCRTQVSHTGAWWRRRSLDLGHGSKADGLDLELMVPLGAGTEGSGSVELQGGAAAEIPGRSEESWGTGHREDDPALQSVGWSSW